MVAPLMYIEVVILRTTVTGPFSTPEVNMYGLS